MSITFVSDVNKDELLKEEWVDIADITTTEEVNKFEFTTDINGNSFECRKIIANVYLPTATTGIWGICWGREGWHAYCSVSTGATSFTVTAEIEKGIYAKYTKQVNTGGEHYAAEHQYGEITRMDYENAYISWLNKFVVEEYGDYTFPIGTQIKIWGLKA